MQGIAYEERGVYRFDEGFNPKDEVDKVARIAYINQFKATPVEVHYNA